MICLIMLSPCTAGTVAALLQHRESKCCKAPKAGGSPGGGTARILNMFNTSPLSQPQTL